VGEASDGGEGQSARAEEVRALVRGAIEATRKLAVDLSPPVLKNEGLVPMVIWLGAQIKDAHGLEVTVRGQSAQPMSDGMRVLLYQATRELLFNVVKHAGAKHATVEISQVDGILGIDVTDDGGGFDPKDVFGLAVSSEHFGLSSLRERLSLFGGNLGIESQPGGGS